MSRLILMIVCSLWIEAGQFEILDGKLICSPDRVNGRCQWIVFGWSKYHGCGYKQKTNEHLCIRKTFDGSKSTFLTKMNLPSNEQYCLQFQYLITGLMSNSCMHFYAKTWRNIHNQSRLFSTFCISDQQSELRWHTFRVVLPQNTTMINVVTESKGIASNHSLILKDLSIQQCLQISTLSNERNSIAEKLPTIEKSHFVIRHRWLMSIGIGILFLIILVFFIYVLRRNISRQSTVTERIQIAPVNISQHFYEEPISIILPPTIDISVYDHVRDNYI